jgi:GTP-binding protein
LPEVAFLGRSNVGKSSLLNALAGTRNLARVSGRPGHTRLVNFYRVGGEMYLADLPGYGYARVPEAMRRGWEELVTSYLVGREPLALGVFLVDLRHEPMEGDKLLRTFLDQEGLPYVIAATKADALGRGQVSQRVKALRSGLGLTALDVVAVSAKTGDGVPALWKTIREAAGRRREELKEEHA